MQGLAAVSALAMVVASAGLIATALAVWLRDLACDRHRGQEPSPVNERVAPFMLLTALLYSGVRWASGESLTFVEAVFPAAFIGFALSSVCYLDQRLGWGLSTRRLDLLGLAVAGAFGSLWGLAPH